MQSFKIFLFEMAKKGQFQDAVPVDVDNERFLITHSVWNEEHKRYDQISEPENLSTIERANLHTHVVLRSKVIDTTTGLRHLVTHHIRIAPSGPNDNSFSLTYENESSKDYPLNPFESLRTHVPHFAPALQAGLERHFKHNPYSEIHYFTMGEKFATKAGQERSDPNEYSDEQKSNNLNNLLRSFGYNPQRNSDDPDELFAFTITRAS
jgi:hypothetical protein